MYPRRGDPETYNPTNYSGQIIDLEVCNEVKTIGF